MTNSTTKTIGENIRFYRKQRGFSQEQLGELTDISTDYISLIELNKRVPSIKRLYLIAESLGIEPYLLLKPGKVSTNLDVIARQ